MKKPSETVLSVFALWTILHLFLLVYGKHFGYANNFFWPIQRVPILQNDTGFFDNLTYDITEFAFYILSPILLYYVVTSLKGDLTVEDYSTTNYKKLLKSIIEQANKSFIVSIISALVISAFAVFLIYYETDVFGKLKRNIIGGDYSLAISNGGYDGDCKELTVFLDKESVDFFHGDDENILKIYKSAHQKTKFFLCNSPNNFRFANDGNGNCRGGSFEGKKLYEVIENGHSSYCPIRLQFFYYTDEEYLIEFAIDEYGELHLREHFKTSSGESILE